MLQLQPDDITVAKEWETKLSEATKRFKENSAIIVSTKEKENEDLTMTEEELYRVSRISFIILKIGA